MAVGRKAVIIEVAGTCRASGRAVSVRLLCAADAAAPRQLTLVVVDKAAATGRTVAVNDDLLVFRYCAAEVTAETPAATVRALEPDSLAVVRYSSGPVLQLALPADCPEAEYLCYLVQEAQELAVAEALAPKPAAAAATASAAAPAAEAAADAWALDAAQLAALAEDSAAVEHVARAASVTASDVQTVLRSECLENYATYVNAAFRRNKPADILNEFGLL